MPEVIDWGEKFRQLGADVSNAITEPVKVRLQMATMKRQIEKEDKLDAAKERASTVIGQQYGEAGQAFYDAGDFGSFLKMKQLDISASRGRGGNGTRSSGNKYFDQFNLGMQMVNKLHQDQAATQAEVEKARQSGDLDALSSAMDKANAMQDARMQVKAFIGSFTTEGRAVMQQDLLESIDAPAAAPDSGMSDGAAGGGGGGTPPKSPAAVGGGQVAPINIGQELDDKLKVFDDDKLDAIQTTVRGGVDKSQALSSKILTSLDNSTNEYGLKIDLSGVPSDAALKTYLATSVVKGGMSMSDAKLIMANNDYKQLAAVANDDSLPESVRKAAGAKFMRMTTFEALFPDGKERLKKAQDVELANLAFQDGQLSAKQRALQAPALQELKERGRFQDDKGPSSDYFSEENLRLFPNRQKETGVGKAKELYTKVSDIKKQIKEDETKLARMKTDRKYANEVALTDGYDDIVKRIADAKEQLKSIK